MVDQARGELYARVFDVSADVVQPSQKREIRFPITVGVAGNVASTGKVGTQCIMAGRLID